MKMKNYLKVLSSVMLLAFLGSCSGEEGKESVSGQGSIMVDLSTNLSYSRAVDESAYRNVNNYKVSLYKGEEPVYTDQLYGDLDVEQKVDFGVSYTLTAYYGEDVAAGYDKLYVKGSYNPQIQISAESETKRSIFREKDKTKRSKKESAQHSKSRNKSFVMTSVSAL